MTRIEKFSSPAKKNSFASLSTTTDLNSEINEYSDFAFTAAPVCDSKAQLSKSLPMADDSNFSLVRTSSRLNKASTASMKDSQKVFGNLSSTNKLPAVVRTADSSETIAEATHDVTMDAALEEASEALPPLAPIDIAQLEAMSSSICEVFREVDPKTTTVLSQILSNLFSKIQSLETALQVRTAEAPKIVSYAAAASVAPKRTFHTEFRSKLAEATTAPARNKVLSESWEARGLNNKRLLLDRASDAHLLQEDESFMVVHMAGFDLLRDEPRATVSAVLIEKFGLNPATIVNISPIAPKLQELHIVSSRLSDLRAAVAKSNGVLKVSTCLDASKPGFESFDSNILAESKARFNNRLERDIKRLSSSHSRRLRDLSDFLFAYKKEGTRQSTPRPRRSAMYASAFLDDALFQASEPSMVVEQC